MGNSHFSKTDRLAETFFPGILELCVQLGIGSPSQEFGAEKIRELCLRRLLDVYPQWYRAAHPTEREELEEVENVAADEV